MFSALGFVVCMWKPLSSLIGSVYHMLEFVGGVTVCLIVACRIRQFQRRKWPKVRKPVSKSLWVWTIILLLVHRIQCHQATTLSESPFSHTLFNFLSLECIYFCLACMIAWLDCRGVYLHGNCLRRKKNSFVSEHEGRFPPHAPIIFTSSHSMPETFMFFLPSPSFSGFFVVLYFLFFHLTWNHKHPSPFWCIHF